MTTARAAVREYALAWQNLMEALDPQDSYASGVAELERRSERFRAASVAIASVPEAERPSELVEFLTAEANSPWSKTADRPDGPPEQIERWRICRANLVALGLSLE